MNPKAQRIAIAEACGFRKEEPWLDGRECWGHKDHPPHVGFEEIPDYLNDLNAMHEAEKVLSLADLVKYGGAIVRALKKSNEKNVFVAFAPAAQRAEAFLRTLNLWKP